MVLATVHCKLNVAVLSVNVGLDNAKAEGVPTTLEAIIVMVMVGMGP